MNKKAIPYIFLAVLAVLVLVIKTCKTPASPKQRDTVKSNENRRGLNRNPDEINYTKHARCRMDCRKISEQEVEDILKNGEVNYRKSDVNGNECNREYAVEGYSKDKQHLRIVFAPCQNEVTVITCIDLDTEWECACPGDENKK